MLRLRLVGVVMISALEGLGGWLLNVGALHLGGI